MADPDRRRNPRIGLSNLMRGAVGATRVYVEDASLSGIRVIHQAPLPAPGAVCRVDLPSEVGPISLDCEIVHTVTMRALYHSGLQIVAPADRQSAERMRSLFRTKR
jgi:hypothetical protein